MLLVFDCDGVVVDSMLLHNEIEARVLRTAGINILPEELRRRFAGVAMSSICKILEQETGRTISPEIEATMEREKIATFRQQLQPIAGVGAALDALSDFPRCIASGSKESEVTAALETVGLYDRFAPHIFSTERVEHGKPAPDLFLLAARHVGIPAQDCLVIEDGVAGVLAGVAAGMTVFGFVGGSHCGPNHSDKLRQAGAETVFSNMQDLPRLARAHALKATS